jgi:uracil-DNA glycosylase family 4
MQNTYNSDCKKCKRLSQFLADIKHQHADYFCKPVPAFGHNDPRLLIVGLAPGMHGANRTGRPFTGDYAGVSLYKNLYKYGFSSNEESVAADDGLKLVNCKITNAVKCLPPQNKPNGSEINNCNSYLKNEITSLKRGAIILSLGGIAHRAVIKSLDLKQADYKFGHAEEHEIGELKLINSYHCSRYNLNTRRLSLPMFESIFERIKVLSCI